MTYTLYSMQNSGNCYKPRLLMHQLGLDFRLVDTDSFDGSTRKPEYLALNPNGKVPLLILPDGRSSPNRTRCSSTSPRARPSCPPTPITARSATSGSSSSSTATNPMSRWRARWLTQPDGTARMLRRAARRPPARGNTALAVMEQRLAASTVVRRRGLFRRRHRPLRLYARRCRRWFRPRRLSAHPGLARPGGRGSRPCRDRLAAVRALAG